MSRKAKLLACLGVALAPWLFSANASADEQFAVAKIINIPANTLNPAGGINSFDIGFVDANIQTYVLADRTNFSVDVINTNTNTYVRQLTGCGGNVQFPGCTVFVGVQPGTNTSGPNGAIIVDQREIWAPDGVSAASPTSKVHVIDLATNSLIKTIDVGGTRRADELCEAVKREVVLVANDDAADNFLTFISSESYSVLQQIKLDGNDPNGAITLTPPPAAGSKVAADGIEQCKFDPRTEAFYLAVPATKITSASGSTAGPGVVLKISKHAPFHVEETFTIATSTGCTGPQGLAIGPQHQIILGCGTGSTASLIIDDRDGSVIHQLNGLGGADEAWYNPGDNQYFIAASNNAVPQLGVVDPNGSQDPLVKTAAGSHSVSADMINNQVYVPGNRGATALCGGTNGCIAVFTAPDDDQCLAQGMPVLDHDDGDDPVFMRTRCHRDDDDGR